MPEGDTVWQHCQRLHRVLAGQVLTRGELRVPRHAAADLRGLTVLEVVARGKHQIFRLEGGHTLHTHLQMDGTWRIVDAAQRPPGPAHQVRVLLATAAHTAVGLRLPVVQLLPTAREDSVIGHLGPDLLGPDWDEDEAVRRLLASPAPTIGEALLDQRNLAGIGTLYRAETLFYERVHPRTPVADVPDLIALVRRAKALLEANKHGFAQVTTGDMRRGGGHYVFERTGRPCLRCGTPIERETFGPAGQERLSYWCPSCQPAPDPR